MGHSDAPLNGAECLDVRKLLSHDPMLPARTSDSLRGALKRLDAVEDELVRVAAQAQDERRELLKRLESVEKRRRWLPARVEMFLLGVR